jgi:catechol 2,3-dioxygenase-like lactoylglutathione lyase family enzyme
MKRMHVHVAVRDLDASVRFYSDLFAAAPSVVKPDYAKWMLDDPRVNFAISSRSAAPGLSHLGIQVEAGDELAAIHARLEDAGRTVLEKGAATCCYAQSDKGWVVDPQGIAWETFMTHGAITTYGTSAGATSGASATACCEPAAARAEALACCGPAR